MILSNRLMTKSIWHPPAVQRSYPILQTNLIERHTWAFEENLRNRLQSLRLIPQAPTSYTCWSTHRETGTVIQSGRLHAQNVTIEIQRISVTTFSTIRTVEQYHCILLSMPEHVSHTQDSISPPKIEAHQFFESGSLGCIGQVPLKRFDPVDDQKLAT